jgi:hypothetical protein
MNLDFFIFNFNDEKPITLIDPIKGVESAYDIEEFCNYLADFHRNTDRDGSGADVDPKLKIWWDRKWYVGLDYYLCSPTQITNSITKKTAITNNSSKGNISLSDKPIIDSFTPIQAILHRKTYREFKDQPVSWHTCSALLHTLEGEFFPDIWNYYLVALNIDGLSPGVYRYYSKSTCLGLIQPGFYREKLTEALCGFYPTRTAAFTIILAINVEIAQSTLPYNRALREIYIDAGRLGQKLLIKGIQQGIGGVPIAMRDSLVGKLLRIDIQEIMPVHSITMGLIPEK